MGSTIQGEFEMAFQLENAIKAWAKDCLGKELKSTFISDFVIAEKFGTKAIEDTYERAYAEWSSDITMLAEMYCCMMWLAQLRPVDIELHKTYVSLSDKLYKEVYSKKNNYSEEDKQYFFEFTD